LEKEENDKNSVGGGKRRKNNLREHQNMKKET